MIDMSSWPQRPFDVTNELRLDPQNVRLGLPHDASQGDIIQDLFQNEQAMDLAEAIVGTGLLTLDMPMVLQEDGSWFVVEGNRRTAAIKALLNPFLVPGFQATLDKLQAEIPNRASLQTLTCVVAPNRDSANQVLAALHTANPRKPWAPLRQADFFFAQVRGGKTVAQLQHEYIGIDVAAFIKMAEMHRLLQTVNYSESELRSYVEKRTFPISVWDRLYANDEFLQLAKLEVDKASGHVTRAGRKADFDKLAEKIVIDIRDKRINTRSLNRPDTDSYKKYMAELAPLAVRPVRAAAKVAVVAAPIAQAPPRPPRPGNHLNMADLQPVQGFPSLARIFRELSEINYREFPNATFDLIRTYLEKSIKARADRDGQHIRPNNPSGFVMLDACLAWIYDVIKAHKVRSLEQVVNRLRAERSFTHFPYTKEYLDAANHNHQIFITPEDVSSLWDSLLGLLKFIATP